MQDTRENKMGVMPVGKLILNMSLPMMISMLVQALYNIVDSIYVSHVSEAALTAVSLSFPMQNLMIGLGTGTAVGVNALLSRALGAKEHDRANRVAENGVFLALVSYIMFLVIGLTLPRAFLSFQTQVGEIINYGVDYLTVVCCFSLGMYMQIMFERLMQSTGRTVLTMITQATGAIINIILDPIFIFTFGLEVRGAAIATVIGQILAACFAITLNHLRNPEVRLNLRAFRPHLPTIGGIYAIAVPSVIMVGIGSIMTFLMNKILIVYTAGKETAAAVFGVYFKLNSFVFMPIFGLNNGVIPIIAYNYGAGNRRRMIKALKIATCFAFVLMSIGLLFFECVPGTLLGFFDASDTMLAIGIPALRIIALTFPVAAICIVLGASFQALGFGTYSMYVSLARQLIVLIPAAWILARIGQQVGNDDLVWLSYLIAEVVSLLITVFLFLRMKRSIIDKVPEGRD